VRAWPLWVKAVGGGLALVVIIVIVIVATSTGKSVSDTLICNRVGSQLNQALPAMSSQVASNPQKAAKLLNQYAGSFRQAAQSASAFPTLQAALNQAATDMANASTDLADGNVSKLINTDLPRLNHDATALNKICG
jgi:hypothetical protein